MVKAIISVGIGLVFLATVLIIIVPLIDMVLNEQVINAMNTALNNVEYFVGSKNLNIFLILFCTTLVLIVFKFLFKFFKNGD